MAGLHAAGTKQVLPHGSHAMPAWCESDTAAPASTGPLQVNNLQHAQQAQQQLLLHPAPHLEVSVYHTAGRLRVQIGYFQIVLCPAVPH